MAKTLDEHYSYLSDQVKMAQYQAAIEQVVHPEHVVLDLGCGSGSLGLMALRAGARKVIFVEEETILEVARQTVGTAGFSDQAEFFQENSFQLELPELVDIVICDHVGYFGFDYGILSLLSDARQRFLKPGGIFLPRQMDLLLAPVESDTCRELVSQWRDGSVPDDFSWLSVAAANTKHAMSLEGPEFLANPAALAALRLGDDAPPYLSWTAEFVCARNGQLDGVAGWFDCQLTETIHMTNSPLAEESLDRPLAFLPLEEPAQVSAGDVVQATIMARHLDNVIGWVIEFPGSGQRFAHTTFNGLLLDRESLTRAHPDRVAKLNRRGHARQVVLSYCDGTRSVGEVQALVQREHPDLFPSEQAATAFINDVLTWETGE